MWIKVEWKRIMLYRLLRLMKWLLLLPLLYALWLTARMLLFDYFTIPTGSMKPTIQPGDKVVVNKLVFGARIYTDLHFNTTGQELKSFRMKGLRSLRRGDIVVFNYPLHGDRISFRINHVYCKRIVGLPGDTVSAVGGYLQNNNHEELLGNEKMQRKLAHRADSVLKGYEVFDVAPFDEHFHWTIKDWGPVYVPRRGDVVRLTPREATLYNKVLEWETGKKITCDWDSGKVYADGKEIRWHTFKHNYYYMLGDHAPDSNDSRYWGVVPEEYIVGVVWLRYAQKEKRILNS